MTVSLRALTKRFGGAVLVCTGVLACLLAVVPAAFSASGCTPPKTAWNFVSAPKLHPAHIHVCTHKSSAAPGMVLLGPFKDAQYGSSLVGQPGALMVNPSGNPVWFHRAPKGHQDSDFQTDSYGATQQKVISFWQGIIAIPPKYTKLPAGAPVEGAYFIYDQHYHVIRKLQAIQNPRRGWITDFHELILTPPSAGHPQGTAIFLAAKKVAANLRKYGGAPNGAYEDEEIQQVDLAHPTQLIFHWDIGRHIPLSASKVHAPKSGVWDAYHANSINLNSAGDMLLSLRNTFGVYNLKPTGSDSATILWKLINGKGSDYKLAKNARFFWQHDVRFNGPGEISMFDDGCCNLGVSGPQHAARGLVLRLSKGRATVARQVHHYNTAVVPTSGNYQPLGNGRVFIGWGQSYYYSEYSKSNSLVYDAAMPKPDMSYRAVKAQWVGMPTTKTLNAAVRHSGSKATVYASWNGATQVAKWKVLGGSGPSSQTTPRGQASRTGFETAIHLSGQNHYFKVEALDGQGHVLGSKVIKNSG